MGMVARLPMLTGHYMEVSVTPQNGPKVAKIGPKWAYFTYILTIRVGMPATDATTGRRMSKGYVNPLVYAIFAIFRCPTAPVYTYI